MYACGDLSAGHSRLVVDIMCYMFTVMLTAIKRHYGWVKLVVWCWRHCNNAAMMCSVCGREVSCSCV